MAASFIDLIIRLRKYLRWVASVAPEKTPNSRTDGVPRARAEPSAAPNELANPTVLHPH